MYHQVEHLPFAHGSMHTVTQPWRFNLKTSGQRVTLVPGHSPHAFPRELLNVVHEELNYVINEGQTYPHHEPVDWDGFVALQFQNLLCVLVEGDYDALGNEDYWRQRYLGSFYIKSNYPGRCSHVCNGGFIVNHKRRGLGLGRELGEKYLVCAKQLGYVYLVFNLVFETNVASYRLWKRLGFDEIGYIKDAAVLKGHDTLVGAYMFGKSL